MNDSSHTDEELFFEGIKELRDSYFIEYLPPVGQNPIASLSIVALAHRNSDVTRPIVEQEIRRWLARYPVPLIASAYDESEDHIHLNDSDSNTLHLFGWKNLSGEIVVSDEAGELDGFLKANPIRYDLRVIYAGVPFKTKSQVKIEADKFVQDRRRQNRLLKGLFFVWFVLVPLGVAVFEYLGPEWLGVVILMFSFYKAWTTLRRILGRLTPSARENARAEKERKMGHYYYHCERNPLGFQRLLAENQREVARKNIREEASRLAGTTTDQ